MKRSLAALLVGGVIAPSQALAAPKGSATLAEGRTAGSEPSATRARRPPRAAYRQLPWIRRYGPQRNLGEIGLFGGVFMPSERHDLYDPVTRPPEPFWRAGPDVGVRAAFYPLRVLGVEAEFNAMPTRLRNVTNDFAFVYGFQAHALVQLPFFRVIPFFLAGGGLLGVRSNVLVLGNDVDPAVHYGGGVKFNLTRVLGLRVDVRNLMSSSEALQNSGAAHVQVLGGLSFTIGHKPPKAPPAPPPPVDPDRDKDGIVNERDECPDEVGVRPHGCPDTDGDGFRDQDDACPEVQGVAPDGCPAKDTDGDGLLDHDDDCVLEPETPNGYEDDDGCPDEMPAPLKVFSGTIDGIEFEFGKATIRPISRSVLDRAVAVLKEYPEVRVNVVGHTDDIGSAEANLELSKRRAEAVKMYLVDAGIEPDRIDTAGRGQDQPRVPNDSDANRAKNRRIEFEILSRRASGRSVGTPAAAPPDASGDPPKPEPPQGDPPKPEPPQGDPPKPEPPQGEPPKPEPPQGDPPKRPQDDPVKGESVPSGSV